MLREVVEWRSPANRGDVPGRIRERRANTWSSRAGKHASSDVSHFKPFTQQSNKTKSR